jgi:hypothetical protein
VGRTNNCPLCEANFYCRTSTSKDVCPLHTTSNAGSYSRVNCLCDPGYQCSYYKQIQAVVTLNATLWEFNNDVNGVRTAFIAAMAAAAGVHPSFVTINEVLTQARRRRALLSISTKEGDAREMIDVHASVTGAVRLRDLDKHLDRHSTQLHVSHRWVQAPQIQAVAIRSASSPNVAVRRMAKIEPIAKPKLTGEALKEAARNRVKSVKLVNNDFLMGMLNQDI